tara:strand:- start:7802 stop:8326 length:525 start_codon:yes stop_codon:yes gene_type:complete
MIAEDIDNVNIYNLIISQASANSIIPESKYYKLLYSTNYLTFYSLYIEIKFKDISINHIDNFITINEIVNRDIIYKLKLLEINILKNLNLSNKKCNYKLCECLDTNIIKYVNNYQNISTTHNKNMTNTINNNIISRNSNIILKISGIWESNNYYGISFKFILPYVILTTSGIKV